MKHDLSIDRADIDSPLGGIGFERFGDIVSGSLFRETGARSRSVVVNDRDLGIDFGAFRASASDVVQSDAPDQIGKTRSKLTVGQMVVLALLAVLVIAVVIYSVIYATHPYMVSGLLEYYLMYLPIPVDYN